MLYGSPTSLPPTTAIQPYCYLHRRAPPPQKPSVSASQHSTSTFRTAARPSLSSSRHQLRASTVEMWITYTAPLIVNHYRTTIQSCHAGAWRRLTRCHRISSYCSAALFATHPWPPPPKPSLSQLYVSNKIPKWSSFSSAPFFFPFLVNLIFFFVWVWRS